MVINGTNLLGGGDEHRIGQVCRCRSDRRSAISTDDAALLQSSVPPVLLLPETWCSPANTGAITHSEPVLLRYVADPNITSVTPASGQLGTVVTIAGTNMLGGGASVASVTLGGSPVGSIDAESNTVVVVTVADVAAAAGGDVVVTADTGAEVTLAGAWEYLAKGTITSITPAAGQLGNVVAVVGERLLGGGASVDSFKLAGIAATGVSANNTHLFATVALSEVAITTGNVAIVANTGAQVTLVNGWEYHKPGNITDISPNVGQKGTRVIITGETDSFFADGSSVQTVTLVGVAAAVTGSSSTEINVTAASTAADGTGDVVVISSTGLIITQTNGFTYSVDGEIAAVEPSQGVGGAKVTIYGTDLQGQATSVTSVTLSGVAAVIDRQSNYLVTVTVAESTAGAAGSVVLTADSGAVITKAAAWTYATAGAITSVTPSSGAAGTVVTIEGSALRSGATAVASATLAGIEVESVSFENDTYVTVIAGLAEHPSPKGDVVLTSSSGNTVTLEDAWNYTTVTDVHSVSPSQGQYGTRVTVSGVELLSGASGLNGVTLAGVAVTSIVSESKTSVVVKADTSAVAVTGDIVLTASNGAEAKVVSGWTYVAKPVITGISPVEGQIGTVVTITGTTLLAGGASIDSAQLAGSPVQEVVSSNDTHVVVVAAGNTSLTVGKVLMVNDVEAEIESATDLWTYLVPASTIDDVSPVNGQSQSRVVISGSNLFGGGSAVVSVSLAGATATIVSQNDSVVIVTAASNAAGTGAVKLTSDSGATTVLDNGFEYVAVASVDSVVPSSGQLNTVATITGSGLLGGGSSFATVTMAGTSTTVVSGNDTHVVVRVGSGTAGVGAVVLTATSGAVVSSGAACVDPAHRRQHHIALAIQRCAWCDCDDLRDLAARRGRRAELGDARWCHCQHQLRVCDQGRCCRGGRPSSRCGRCCDHCHLWRHCDACGWLDLPYSRGTSSELRRPMVSSALLL